MKNILIFILIFSCGKPCIESYNHKRISYKGGFPYIITEWNSALRDDDRRYTFNTPEGYDSSIIVTTNYCREISDTTKIQ